jgi:hypothetical protein
MFVVLGSRATTAAATAGAATTGKISSSKRGDALGFGFEFGSLAAAASAAAFFAAAS